MALDMGLVGRTSITPIKEIDGHLASPMMDGFEISDLWYRLGFWRNRPDLHEYITERYADGDYSIDFILLGPEGLDQICDAIRRGDLSKHAWEDIFGVTEPSPQQISTDVETFTKAKNWCERKQPHETRLVYYQAIW